MGVEMCTLEPMLSEPSAQPIEYRCYGITLELPA